MNKKILLTTLFLNIYTISFSSNPTPEKITNADASSAPAYSHIDDVRPETLGQPFAVLISDKAPFVFANKAEAQKQHWSFKEQLFNPRELVLYPVSKRIRDNAQSFIINNRENALPTAVKAYEKIIGYRYGLCLGMKDASTVRVQYNFTGFNYIDDHDSKEIGRLPEHDSDEL